MTIKHLRLHKKLDLYPEERMILLEPPDIPVSQCAEESRLIAEGGSEPGPWRNDRAPYLVDIMDSFNDPDVERVIIIGPAQCGKTEAAWNMLGYTLKYKPVRSLYVTASEEVGERNFNERLYPMFAESPAYAKFLTGKAWDVKKGASIKFRTMTLDVATARSAILLASTPYGVMVLDEVDKYPAFVGNEGNPIKLTERRGTTFPDRKSVYICTLTTRDGASWKIYEISNRARFWIPCVYCGRFFDPRRSQLKTDPPGMRDADEILEKKCVYYECESCGKRIYDSQRYGMIADGVWVPAGCGVNDENGHVTGRALRPKRNSGYWISGLISRWLSWPKLMAQQVTAENEESALPGELREFVNQAAGELWEEKGLQADEKKLHAHIGDYSGGTVPDGCMVLVAGVDYHEKKTGYKTIDFEVRGFGRGLRRWLISEGAVETWEELENEILFAPFPWSNPEGQNKNRTPLGVICVFVDSGYMPDRVYDFCMRYPGLTYPIKGASNPMRTPITASDLDRAALARTGKKWAGLQAFIIDTSFFKDRIAGSLEREPGEAGSTTFYDGVTDRYFKELCGEHKIKVLGRYGQASWRWEPVSKGAATHHLDTGVYAEAAAFFKRVHVSLGLDEGETVKRPAGMLREQQPVRRIGKMYR